MLLLSVGSDAWEVVPGEIGTGTAGMEAKISPSQWEELTRHGSTDSEAFASTLHGRRFDELRLMFFSRRSDDVAMDGSPR